jgi:hypothetical protein
VSELRNGNFGSGFLAGGVSSLAPVPVGKQSWESALGGTTESVTLGGLGSVLGGGKFLDGAITGAFGYLFNYCMHNPCPGLTASQTAQANQIDAYIAQHAPGSPLVGHGSEIVADSVSFGIDPTFTVGVADAESTFGINLLPHTGTYNIFSDLYNGAGNTANFDSIDSAIYSFTHMIGRIPGMYFGSGLFSASAIYGTYCSGSGCSAGLSNIDATMRALGGNPNNVRYNPGH